MSFELKPEWIAENNDAIAAYEAACVAGDHRLIWPTFSKVEQCMNSMGLMGLGAEHERIRIEMNRITRERRERRQAERHYAIAAE